MLAGIATLEQGKPLAEARGEVIGAAGILDFHAGEALRARGRVAAAAAGHAIERDPAAGGAGRGLLCRGISRSSIRSARFRPRWRPAARSS
ncbi:MAG: hypothetical protein QM703_28365 [Gemmatales bacterium]